MAKTRTFIAVPAEGEVRGTALAQIDQLSPAAPNVKWVEPDRLHWTLQFLGDIDDLEMAQVCRRVVKVAQRHEPFVLMSGGVSAFPSVAKPRTLYLAANEGSKAFRKLQAEIEASLDDLGFRGERRQFVPHLTLGRVGRGDRRDEQLATLLSETTPQTTVGMPVDEVIVYASRLQRSGPEYTVLATAPLGQ